MDIDLETEPLGIDKNGQPVYLRDVWPTQKEVMEAINSSIRAEMFRKAYEESLEGDQRWKVIDAPSGELFQWDPSSTYVKRPPFFENISRTAPPPKDIRAARVLAVLGDSVTTDHISPAGSIAIDSPARQYLIDHGVAPKDFNSYGARRGNHEAMMRGTFANIRIRNKMVPEIEGGYTVHLPDGEPLSIYDAAMKYKAEGVPTVVLAGKEYGTGSSRDWAAKGPLLQGVRAVIAESFERIHRSNLVGMGILPLQYAPGENAHLLGLTGEERYTIHGLNTLKPGQHVEVKVVADDGRTVSFTTRARVDNETEIGYLHHGGILPLVLRELIAKT